MPSPFPGMDPYLEGYLWPDVHQAMATKIRQQLTPLVRPRYTARLAVYVVEDSTPESEIGIMYSDVEVLQQQAGRPPSTVGSSSTSTPTLPHATATPAVLTLPVVMPVDVQVVSVEIRDTAQHQLVTCIEVLSPVNKREPGFTAYRRKRQRLIQALVHLLEVESASRHKAAYTCERAMAPFQSTWSNTKLVPFWCFSFCQSDPNRMRLFTRALTS